MGVGGVRWSKVLVGILGSVAIIAMLSSGFNDENGETKREQMKFAQVVRPQLPDSLYFAAERVPLENYDTRESLERELLIASYMHSRTMVTLLNSRRYISIIEPLLQKNGVPRDFIYLCMAESGFDPNVVSSAGASGLWQIMPGTGRDFGLLVGKEVDERYDIEKATEVACKHLKESYDIFGNWTMAAAAYNLGNNGVTRRVDLQGVENYYDSFFPSETLRYIFRVLAWKLVSEDPVAYGYMIGEGDYYPVLTDYRVVEVAGKGEIEWSEVAAKNGTTYKMLRELNHWIRDYSYKNAAMKTFKVKVPNGGYRESDAANGDDE